MALAYKELNELPQENEMENIEEGLTLICILGMSDPLKIGVADDVD
jgi:magnesium-transporting ATPase (P-type)